MKKSSKFNFFDGGIKTRIFLSLVVFFVSNLIYPDVFATVGYMYEVSLNISYINYIIGLILLIILLVTTHFKSLILRHGFDIAILGTFLPIAVISAQISTEPYFMLYPAFSILSMTVSVRIFEQTRFIKHLNNKGFGNIHISRIQYYTFLPYSLIIILLIASNPSVFNLNLLDTYVNTYVIRAETSGDGLIGYFIGWFVLLFFPLFLCKLDNRLIFWAPLSAFIGALYFFQAYAVKVIFLNFFLIAIFANIYGRRYSSHFPQFFFILLFLLTGILGLLMHPLLDRFFYTIGINSIFYFDFFYKNPLRFFEGSKLDFGLSNYGLDAGFIIDKVYYQGLGSNQSAGFLPSIYADLGLSGVILFSLLIGLIFSLIKSIQYSSAIYSYLLMVAFSFALINHTINMLFLSNGLMFILFFSLILKREK